MFEKIRPLTLEEINEGQRITGAVTLEVWFYVPSFDIAAKLMEALLAAEFVSVKPSNMISSVRIIRPSEANNRVSVVARTDSQRVPLELLSFFHEEMALLAQQNDCCFGGSEMVGTASSREAQEYRRQARQCSFSHTVFVH